MDEPVKRIDVRAPGGAYEILVGSSILHHVHEKRELLSRDRCALFVSAAVHALHGDMINSVFGEYPVRDVYQVRDGEEFKNYRHAEEAFNWLLEKGYGRRSSIVGIGGGAVGDFAGFVAALFMRGIPVIHVPTTLLAMVDSSIGGKVAVNLDSGKNIVGAFYQPRMVLSDVRFLETLPETEFRNGLAEAVKHALIGESRLLEIFRQGSVREMRNPAVIEEVVYRSALFKASVICLDEREEGPRAILNFGHTVGHAIESLLQYRGISHGEAVALGLKAELELSRRRGWLADNEHGEAMDLLERYDLIRGGLRLRGRDVVEHVKYDKKKTGGAIRGVLLKGIGNPVYGESVDEALLAEVLDEVLG